jgi:hypothetical protein
MSSLRLGLSLKVSIILQLHLRIVKYESRRECMYQHVVTVENGNSTFE